MDNEDQGESEGGRRVMRSEVFGNSDLLEAYPEDYLLDPW
jgi:hypothetical protein